MESRATGPTDQKRFGHAQVAFLLSDLLSRPVFVVIHDRNTGEEIVYSYAPGFTSFVGGFGNQLHGVFVLFFLPIYYFENRILIACLQRILISYVFPMERLTIFISSTTPHCPILWSFGSMEIPMLDITSQYYWLFIIHFFKTLFFYRVTTIHIWTFLCVNICMLALFKLLPILMTNFQLIKFRFPHLTYHSVMEE